MNDNHHIPDDQEMAEAGLSEPIQIVPQAPGGLYSDFSNAPLTADEEVEPFTPSQELANVIEETINSVRARSYSQRHPELGKMINCPVCNRRHNGKQCEAKYAPLHEEEDLETGEVTKVYRMAAQNTRKGVLGAAVFAKKRFHPHLNRRKTLFIERVRKLFGEGTFNEESPEFKRALNIARRTAKEQLGRERRSRANARRHMQNVSRRINRGLLPAGSR